MESIFSNGGIIGRRVTYPAKAIWNLDGVNKNPLSYINLPNFTAVKTFMVDDSTVNNYTSFTQRPVFDVANAPLLRDIGVSSDYLTPVSSGTYACYFNCYFVGSSGFRMNVAVRWEINGNLQSEESASDYIRMGSGHEEATTSMMTIYDLNANDQLGLRFLPRGYTGDVTLIGSKSIAYMRKI